MKHKVDDKSRQNKKLTPTFLLREFLPQYN